ncbi:hypothetical protein M405DRAFT_248231 [Rhizopogon salebrosus TDB-379]|nr:hypothetical protein M405DRAFT_248231 [Rhizopogon salebrosus TDB-379]
MCNEPRYVEPLTMIKGSHYGNYGAAACLFEPHVRHRVSFFHLGLSMKISRRSTAACVLPPLLDSFLTSDPSVIALSLPTTACPTIALTTAPGASSFSTLHHWTLLQVLLLRLLPVLQPRVSRVQQASSLSCRPRVSQLS